MPLVTQPAPPAAQLPQPPVWAKGLGIDTQDVQIDLANAVYSPTPEEVSRARRNLEAYREAEARGLGATSVDGQLVDAAHVKLAQAVLAQADRQ